MEKESQLVPVMMFQIKYTTPQHNLKHLIQIVFYSFKLINMTTWCKATETQCSIASIKHDDFSWSIIDYHGLPFWTYQASACMLIAFCNVYVNLKSSHSGLDLFCHCQRFRQHFMYICSAFGAFARSILLFAPSVPDSMRPILVSLQLSQLSGKCCDRFFPVFHCSSLLHSNFHSVFYVFCVELHLSYYRLPILLFAFYLRVSLR